MRKPLFLVFIDFPSVNQAPGLRRTVLTLFHSVLTFQFTIIYITIAHHSKGKDSLLVSMVLFALDEFNDVIHCIHDTNINALLI